jgi:hypothetical protein
MEVKSSLSHRLIWFVLAITVVSFGCRHIAVVGSPYERYDHNRTQEVTARCADGSILFEGILNNNDYNPIGQPPFPVLQVETPTGTSCRPQIWFWYSRGYHFPSQTYL